MSRIGMCIRCDKADDFDAESQIDLRTLRVSCFYQMDEMNIPFEEDSERNYLLRICKSCRADFLVTMERWFNDKRIGNYNYAIKSVKIGE